jgi:hypothetical protein
VAKYTVRKGRRYRATIKLPGLKRLASNETVRVLRAAGFAEVKVEGSGGSRYAQALWPRADATAEIPPEVVKVEEIGAPIAATARRRVATRKTAPVKAAASRPSRAGKQSAARPCRRRPVPPSARFRRRRPR